MPNSRPALRVAGSFLIRFRSGPCFSVRQKGRGSSCHRPCTPPAASRVKGEVWEALGPGQAVVEAHEWLGQTVLPHSPRAETGGTEDTPLATFPACHGALGGMPASQPPTRTAPRRLPFLALLPGCEVRLESVWSVRSWAWWTPLNVCLALAAHTPTRHTWLLVCTFHRPPVGVMHVVTAAMQLPPGSLG